MSGGRSGKNWTFGTLKSRGWTEVLLQELLPSPVYRYFSGRRVRTWEKTAVLAAEETERFKKSLQAARQAQLQAEETDRAEVSGALRAAAELLRDAWDSGAKPEDAPRTVRLA